MPSASPPAWWETPNMPRMNAIRCSRSRHMSIPDVHRRRNSSIEPSSSEPDLKVLHVFKTYYPDTVGGIEQVIAQLRNNV